MSVVNRGKPIFTHDIVELIDSEDLYLWCDENAFVQGQLCWAPAWYEKNNRWYIQSLHYDPIDEELSTWKALEYPISCNIDRSGGNVQKHFQIEKDEHMIATHCKIRPVILVKPSSSTWFNKTYPKNAWLCIPVFSYKSRHSQHMVIEDQKFNTPDRVYLPPVKDHMSPGLERESAAHVFSMQLIESKYIKKMTMKNVNTNQTQSFRISDSFLKLIIFHMFLEISLIDNILDKFDGKGNYFAVKEYIQEMYDNATFK